MSIQDRVISLAVVAAVAVPAGAQPAPSNQDTFVETVTVTAQKREQNPIDVPMALTAYSGDFLKKVDIQEFDKLSLYVPGFEVQNQSPNNPGLVLRGLTLDSGDATLEPRVSVFEDDVSISTTRATYIELFDIERIEVARGPQTTLFGRAALMGGVNVIQNKADPSATMFSLGGEYGSDAYEMVEGVANIPLSDDFAVRLAGRYKHRHGYVENLLGGTDFNSINTAAGRLSFGWKPTEDFSADVILNYEADHPSGTSFKSGTFLPTDPATGAVIGNLDHNTGAALSTVPGFENNQPLGLRRKVWDAKAILGYRLSNAFHLSSVTAYRRFDSEEVFDPDGFSQPLLVAAEDERGDQFSHEMRLNYDEGGMFAAFVGGDYFYSNVSQRVPLQFDERMSLALLASQGTNATLLGMLQYQPSSFFSSSTFIGTYAPGIISQLAQGLYYNTFHVPMPSATVTVLNAYAPSIAANLKGNHWEQSENYGKTESFDLYGDITARFTDRFEMEGGLRYTHDDKTSSYAGMTADRSILGGLIGAASTPMSETARQTLIAGLGQPNAGSLTLFPPAYGLPNFGLFYQPSANNGDKVSQNFTDDGLSWRITARYALEPETSLYASYARGRRPKVLDALTPPAPYYSPKFTFADAETVDSYEAGVKTLTLDGRLRADAAVYMYQYSNFQTSVLVNNQATTVNAGKANAWGIETTVDWAITDWADFFGTYAYNRARFGGDSIYRGNKFRLNPDHKLSVGLSLRQNALGGSFTLLPTYTWQSKIFFDDDNDIASEQITHILPDLVQDEFQKQYGLLNARLTYAPDNARWTVGVFVTNMLDQKFIKDAGNTGDDLGIPTFIAGEPRFFGASFSFKTP